MPDVVILTARFGHGHLSAAENIREAMAEVCPELSVEIIDPFQETNPRKYRFMRWLYQTATNHFPLGYYWFYRLMDRTRLAEKSFIGNRRMRDFFTSFNHDYQPGLVLNTYPVYAAALEHFHGPKPRRPFHVLTVITDSVAINRAWLRGDTDSFLVADALTSLTLQKKGIPEESIQVTGFPTPPFFARYSRSNETGGDDMSSRKVTILYLPNLGTTHLFPILKVLGDSPKLKVILALGHRRRLIQKVRKFCTKLRCETEVHGWIPEVYRRMLEADLVITKPGGATVHEALAAGCPVIISQVTPGQEEGNARLIESMGLGFVVRNAHSLRKLMTFCRDVDFDVLENMHQNVQKIRCVDAPFRIAKIIKQYQDLGKMCSSNQREV